MSNIGRKYTDTDMQLFHCDSVTCSGAQEWMGEERSGPSDQPARLMEEAVEGERGSSVARSAGILGRPEVMTMDRELPFSWEKPLLLSVRVDPSFYHPVTSPPKHTWMPALCVRAMPIMIGKFYSYVGS